MEPQQKSMGGVLGGAIVILVIVGLLIWLLPKRADMPETQPTNETTTNETTTASPASSDDAADIEQDVNAYDSNTADINFDDVTF